MHRYLILAITLSVLWVALSGYFTNLLLGFGVVSVALVIWIAHRMDAVEPATGGRGSLSGLRLVPYLAWLLKEIVVSNLDVAKVILNPRLPISPTTIRLRSTQRSLAGQVLYANSITLTPGTVSMNVQTDEIVVHSLTKSSALALRDGDMDARVTAVERDQ
ncbi:MAG: Na+/H+ antiporter subunit E [Gammaproteobacteria bacterium]|nr:Na+/H+ antiporter subunit E [Gammaproteobacteria bacterium]